MKELHQSEDTYEDPRDKYNIIRFYQNGSHRVVQSGLTLKEATDHCNHPDSSSKTCTSASKKAITKRNGQWFEGYQRIKNEP